MASRTIVAGLFIFVMTLNAHAENALGYRAISAEEAALFPPGHGSLGVIVERARQISDSGMIFDLIRIKQIRQSSPAQRAGLHVGDAVDGRVFQSLAIFGAYIAALSPGSRAAVDYIPADCGPDNARRVTVALGQGSQPRSRTGEKVAIGDGAAALLGCYEMGCFAPRPAAQPAQAPNSGR
jgi:hypothetical protein